MPLPLAQKLSAPGPVTLSDDERAAVAAALAQLAADQPLILRQQRLLALSSEHAARIRSMAEGAVDLARTLAASDEPGRSYDYAAAQRAREDLAELARSTRDVEAIIAGAIRLARIVLGAA